jgi:hypothetical protein
LIRSFLEICNSLKLHVYSMGQFSKSVRNDVFKTLMPLRCGVKIQEPGALDYKWSDSTPTSNAMICDQSQISPETWMSPHLEAKMWLLNISKCQQPKDEKVEKSVDLSDRNMYPKYQNFFKSSIVQLMCKSWNCNWQRYSSRRNWRIKWYCWWISWGYY